jgi:glycine hydroxymethyltransferase
LTNKYAEGYPGRRYYGGNQFIDVVENLAINRAKKLFGAEHANVQPHSGSQANMAAYMALMEPGEKLMAMQLDQGGHLTHGHSVNFSGKTYTPVHYGVDRKTGMIDYDAVRKLAIENEPSVILSGYTVYPRAIDFKQFKEIADEVGAYAMADMAHIAGLVAAGVHQSPIPYCDVVTSTTHKTLRGPRGGLILCKEDLAQKVDKAVFPGIQGGPLEHVIAGKAVCFKEAGTDEFKDYAKQVVRNSKALADFLMDEGIDLISGGTDNHVMLADVTRLGITGKQAQAALDIVGITVNKNTIPYDTRSPFDPSGIRIGTAALTARGMKECEMYDIARIISKTLHNIGNENIEAKLQTEVKEITQKYPLYAGLEDD